MENVITFIVIFLIIITLVLMTASNKGSVEEYRKHKGEYLKRNNLKATDFVWFKRNVDNEIGFSVDCEKITVVSIVGKRTRKG